MGSPGELNQGSSFIPTPPQTGDLPPVNVDNNNNLMAAAAGEVASSSSSKLPVKRPYHFIKKNYEGLRKSKKEIDKNYRDKKKLKTQKLIEDREELKTLHTKLGVFMKNYRNIKEQAICRLFNMIGEGVRCNVKKEELLAQFCSPNGKQMFEIYWEENLKHKNELQIIVEIFIYLRQVVLPMAAPPVQEGLLYPLPNLDDLGDDFLDISIFDVPIPEPDPRQVVLPESSTRKHKKSKKEIDKEYRDKQKVKIQKLMEDLEVMKTDIAKLEEFLKKYRNIREQAIARLSIMIEKDVRCKLNKEELWAQFCSPNGKQIYDIYWEENMKYRIELREIVIMFLSHPQ